MERHRVEPGTKVRLKDLDPDDTGEYKHKGDAEGKLEADQARLADLQERLYAENRRAVLVVLQGMDTGGKDGTIKHVMAGVNPTGCTVTSFKKPSTEELDHDYLWRIHHAVPNYGNIGIFNRSHYEDVLVVRVHKLVPAEVWRERFEQINAFEKLLADNRVTILKFFLHISRDEQRKRLEARLADREKAWKFEEADIVERRFWDDYQAAYEEAITRCSTPWAPWYVIPANKKWYRNLAVARVLVKTLEKMDPKPPEPGFDPSKVRVE